MTQSHKVKFFSTESNCKGSLQSRLDSLEQEVNQWIEDHQIDVVDIRMEYYASSYQMAVMVHYRG